jgi:hypothetical protein
MVASKGVEDQACVLKEGGPGERGEDVQFHLPGLGAADHKGLLTEVKLELIRPRRKRLATCLEAERNIRA